MVLRCPWVPRVLGSQEYLVYLVRQREHHRHRVHMADMGECPVSGEKKTEHAALFICCQKYDYFSCEQSL